MYTSHQFLQIASASDADTVEQTHEFQRSTTRRGLGHWTFVKKKALGIVVHTVHTHPPPE